MLNRLIMITGATGNRGRDVIGSLLDRVPAERVAGLPRKPEAAADLAVTVRPGDYHDPAGPSTASTSCS